MDVLKYIQDHYKAFYYHQHDFRMLVSLLHSLSKEELKQLSAWLKDKEDNSQNLIDEVEDIINPEVRRPNEAIAELLRLFKDKGSKKVQEARRKLRIRYEHQSAATQRKILRTFLYATKTDRKWALGILKKEWHSCLLNEVKEVWEKYRDEEGDMVVLKHFPQEYLLEHQDELGNGWKYKYLCLRLAKHPQFHIEKERFDGFENKYMCDYLYVMAKTGSKVDGEEVEHKLYQFIADVANGDVNVNTGKSGISLDSVEGWRYNFSTMFIPGVSMVVWCLGRLKLVEELIRYMEWDKEIQRKFSSTWDVEFEYEDGEQYRSYAWNVFIGVVQTNFPEKYKHLLINQSLDIDLSIRDEMMKMNPELATLMDEFGLEIDETPF